MRWAAAGLLVLSGCSCGDIGIRGKQFACSSVSDCADGYACVNGACTQGTGTGDGGATDGGPSDGGQQDAGSADAGGSDGGTPSAARSTVVASPASVLADGILTSTVTVSLKDASGAPLPGWNVSLAVTGSENVLAQPAAPTDANGVATGSLASGRAETKTLTATVMPLGLGLLQRPTVAFTGGAVANVPGGAGCVQYISTAVDPATGHPAIAYSQGVPLLFTECTQNCVANPQWSVPTVVEPDAGQACGDPYETISLAFLPNGNPAVAFVDNGLANCPVKYAVLSGGAWHQSTVDFTNNCGNSHRPASLALVGDAGVPAIAFHKVGGGSSVEYAVCTSNCDTGLGSTWLPQVVATSASGTGYFLSLAVDPTTLLPRLAYSDTSTGSTRYATCSGNCALGTGTWSVGTAAPKDTYQISLAFPPDSGLPGVAFVNRATGAVTYADCTAGCGTGATSTWSARAIDTPVDGGADNVFLQLGFDSSSVARVAYFDPPGKRLRYAVQTGATFTVSTVDTGVTDGHLSFLLGPPGTDFAYSAGNTLRYYPSAY